MAITSGWGGSSWGLGSWGLSGLTSGTVSTLQIRNVAPVVTAIIAETDDISFEVVSPAVPVTVTIAVEFPTIGISELAYGGGLLTPYYSNASSFVSAIADGWAVQLLRTPKWPGTPLNVRVFASDADGNTLTQTLSWTVQEAVAATVVSTGSASAANSGASDPLGFGLVRPFRRVPTNDFATASGEDLVRAAVGQVLGTNIGDIPWRPRFGTRLFTLRHIRNTAALPELARISIQQALQQWEPRITITELTAAPATGANVNKVILSLRYRINNSPESAIRVLL